MCAGQTLTVLAQFEMNEDGLLCPRDKDAFIYKGGVNSAQRHLQEKVEQQRTWQYICAVSHPLAHTPRALVTTLLTTVDRLQLLL